jgi:hypothetical protein
MHDLMTKKNPVMSLWLSAFNSWAGATRGLWIAEIQRQQAAVFNEATRQMLRFWSGGWAIPAARAAAAVPGPTGAAMRLADTALAVQRSVVPVAPKPQAEGDRKHAAQLRSRAQSRPARNAKPTAARGAAKRAPAKRPTRKG